MTVSLPVDVDVRLRADFPPESHSRALAALLRAAASGHGARVLRCIVHLAASDLDELERYARHADIDSRDLMFWAEYAVDDQGRERQVRDFNQPMPTSDLAVADEATEVWEYGPNGSALCALFNGDRGWLMYLRSEDDVGMHSYDPRYRGTADAMMEFTLGNAQVDQYPAAWTLPRAEVERALAYFREHRKPAPFIDWVDA